MSEELTPAEYAPFGLQPSDPAFKDSEMLEASIAAHEQQQAQYAAEAAAREESIEEALAECSVVMENREQQFVEAMQPPAPLDLSPPEVAPPDLSLKGEVP